mgnify:CR=1 FL=1
MSQHKRLKLVEKKVLNPDRLVAILPDWLADEQPAPMKGERVITPRNYLAYDAESNEVYFHD